MGRKAASSTLSTIAMHQRLVVMERYLSSLSRHNSPCAQEHQPKYKAQVTEANLMAQKRLGYGVMLSLEKNCVGLEAISWHLSMPQGFRAI